MIVFAKHNLISDAPFTRLDILTCRNVLIYMDLDLQRRLLPIFAYALASRGVLALGASETVTGSTALLRRSTMLRTSSSSGATASERGAPTPSRWRGPGRGSSRSRSRWRRRTARAYSCQRR